MKVTLLDTEEIASSLKELIVNSDEFYWAVAWGSDGKLAAKLLANEKKIKKIIIGIHFCQTDPDLLEKLSSNKGARVAVGISNGTFHPKMYYFQSGRRASAIVGSANFTEAAVTGNVEAALLVEGSHDDELLLSIRSMIESLWVNGSLIDSSFLESYRLQYEASRRYREVLSKPVRRKNSTENATYSNLLTMSWDDYVEAVKSEAVKSSSNHTLEGRLNVLRKSRLLLDEVNGFSDLSLEQRKAIAGIVGRKEKFGNELDNYDWAWFGSMFGAGSFKNRIAENDHHFTLALEHIPSIGEITRDDYQAFIKEFLRAFEFAERRGGVPTASRLLTMKRPDYFVCANKKNILKLSDDLGFKKTLDFDSYWMDIIEPITQAKWWQVRRPSGVDGRIWDGRAAMIDAIYYDPD